MNKKFITLAVLVFTAAFIFGQSNNNNIYLFSYFKNNGKDGLHLAYSNDGYNWAALNNDSSFLKPTVANDKLMRDPCIIKGADGY